MTQLTHAQLHMSTPPSPSLANTPQATAFRLHYPYEALIDRASNVGRTKVGAYAFVSGSLGVSVEYRPIRREGATNETLIEGLPKTPRETGMVGKFVDRAFEIVKGDEPVFDGAVRGRRM